MGEGYGEDSSWPRTGACQHRGFGGRERERGGKYCSLLFPRPRPRSPGIARAIWSSTRGRSRCCRFRSDGRDWLTRTLAGHLAAWGGSLPWWGAELCGRGALRLRRWFGVDLLSRCGAVLANQVAQAPRTPALALRVEYAHGEVVW